MEGNLEVLHYTLMPEEEIGWRYILNFGRVAVGYELAQGQGRELELEMPGGILE